VVFFQRGGISLGWPNPSVDKSMVESLSDDLTFMVEALRGQSNGFRKSRWDRHRRRSPEGKAPIIASAGGLAQRSKYAWE
jgi:hypothetical protein